MRKIYLVIVMAFFAIVCSAQINRVAKWEGGFYFGVTNPIGAYHNGDAKIGAMMGIDLRYNIQDSPWDFGAFLELCTAMRDFYKDGSYAYQNNRTTVVGIVSHYNFGQGKQVNPYIGLGLGFALNDVVGSRVYPSKSHSLAISPRIGVELLRHLRVDCHTEISRKGFHTIGLTLGLAFGGGKKK